MLDFEGKRRAETAPLLDVEALAVHFPVRMSFRQHRALKAVDGVSLQVRPGECLGLVGESGCGKSTLALAIMGLVAPTAGRIRLAGHEIGTERAADRMTLARAVQMVFQDPYASLNPRQTVRRMLADPLRLHGIVNGSEVDDRVAAMLAKVGLRPEHADRYPHEFSGGQRQRIGIARALAMNPRLIVLDEPVSALDVSIQAQIINLLEELQDGLGLTYLFVAHDLSVVRHVSDRIAVMYLGKIMELSPGAELYDKPIHPYTEALLSAIPIPDPRENRRRQRIVVSGEPPNPINPPPGCVFHTRCPRATEVCRTVVPPLTEYPNGHLAACHHPLNVTQEEIDGSTISSDSPLAAGDAKPDFVPMGAGGDALAPGGEGLAPGPA
jgi:oligopeptide/dipeptide ABC transporter ATP-binding protein